MAFARQSPSSPAGHLQRELALIAGMVTEAMVHGDGLRGVSMSKALAVAAVSAAPADRSIEIIPSKEEKR
jgi:hypothetical protein